MSSIVFAKGDCVFWKTNQYNNPLVLLASVFCFLFFLSLRVSDHAAGAINKIAKCIFAVYVVHMGAYFNGWFDRAVFWVGNLAGGSLPLLMVLLLLASLAVMALVCSVEGFRQLLMSPFQKWIHPACDSLDNKIIAYIHHAK